MRQALILCVCVSTAAAFLLVGDYFYHEALLVSAKKGDGGAARLLIIEWVVTLTGLVALAIAAYLRSSMDGARAVGDEAGGPGGNSRGARRGRSVAIGKLLVGLVGLALAMLLLIAAYATGDAKGHVVGWLMLALATVLIQSGLGSMRGARPRVPDETAPEAKP